MDTTHQPVAIITGAGSGIGREVARLLASHGWRIALLGRRRAALDESGSLLGAAPECWLAAACDVGDPASCAGAIETVRSRWKRVDVLVNNAAALHASPISKAEPAALQKTFAANVMGPAVLIARVWPIMAAQKSGCIVNVSSMAAVDPFPGLAHYAASKAALESLTRSIVNEGRELGIAAYSVAPGAVETAMLRSIVPADQLPPSRTLEPRNVAAVIVDCVLGRRKADIGRVIHLPSP